MCGSNGGFGVGPSRKRKRQERIEPLYNRFEKPNEWRLSKRKPAHRASQTFG